MRMTLKAALGVAGFALAMQAAAQVTFYEREGFRGGSLTADGTISNFQRSGFNDRASSAVVDGGRWEVCEHAGFDGRCMILRPGNYPSLASMGMNDRISSVRPLAGEARYEYPAPPPGERLHEVNVAAVRAVVGPPEQRCWIEREQVAEAPRDGPNVAGAIVGGIIGGVLGHQIGGGRGKDVATAGGAVAGAAIGSNVGRGPGAVYSQDVQRCAAIPDSARPDYWDVTYYFRGIEHHAQLSAPPGPTIWVNDNGEPRG